MDNITITTDQIKAIFEEAEHQSDYAIGIYKLAFPDWDEIKEVKGWPRISVNMNKFIFSLAIDFDKKHHPKVQCGGLWMNKGFGSDSEIDWGIVDLSNCEVIR